jgi:hypothetical protein
MSTKRPFSGGDYRRLQAIFLRRYISGKRKILIVGSSLIMIEATFRAETTARESKGMNRNRLPKKEMRETPKSETGGQESHPPLLSWRLWKFPNFYTPHA